MVKNKPAIVDHKAIVNTLPDSNIVQNLNKNAADKTSDENPNQNLSKELPSGDFGKLAKV